MDRLEKWLEVDSVSEKSLVSASCSLLSPLLHHTHSLSSKSLSLWGQVSEIEHRSGCWLGRRMGSIDHLSLLFLGGCE